MEIHFANPIYDAAFKYLMEDPDVGSLLIGRIADLDVEALTIHPSEMIGETPAAVRQRNGVDPRVSLSVFRMDFAARVRTKSGEERQVLVEIQKANHPDVAARFRRYLGTQLASPENLTRTPSGRMEPIPIVTIYLLGYTLDGLSNEAVLDVHPKVTERRTGRELAGGHPFVEAIHHRGHIVQIPHLAGRRRDALERLLSVFDQDLVSDGRGNRHVLTMDESSYPEEGSAVLRRLQRAVGDERMRRFMEGEDDFRLVASSYLGEAAYYRRQGEEYRLQGEEYRRQGEEYRRQGEEHRSQVARAIRELHILGKDAEAIAGALAVSPAEVRRVLDGNGDGSGEV